VIPVARPLLEGRVALITGGTDGIGKAIALRFLAEGASLVVTGRRADKGDELMQEVGPSAPLAFVQADATNSEDARRVAAAAHDRFGPVGILVNNVGGTRGEFGPFHELGDDTWTATVALNIYSAVAATRAVVPDMLQLRWGRIVLMSSLEGKMCTLPGIAPYVTVKHALAGMAKAIAFDYGAAGITCNALCPGYVEISTRQRKGARTLEAGEAGTTTPQENYLRLARTGRHTTLDEVADAAVMVCGEHGGAITGTAISIDGGSSPY
jgi:NAD(P)-dependent dehydrogenase (short-subunit alcohol dehydrogenase family)